MMDVYTMMFDHHICKIFVDFWRHKEGAAVIVTVFVDH